MRKNNHKQNRKPRRYLSKFEAVRRMEISFRKLLAGKLKIRQSHRKTRADANPSKVLCTASPFQAKQRERKRNRTQVKYKRGGKYTRRAKAA